MKIKYEFATETIAVDVDEEWANILIDLDRSEYNNNHTETRRHVSYDAVDYEGEEHGAPDPALTALLEMTDDDRRLWNAIDKLKPEQQRLIKALFFEEKTLAECAAELGSTQQAVGQRRDTILRKLKKYF